MRTLDNMTNWRNVSTPPEIDALPKDPRGYPVPVITPRTDTSIYMGKQDHWRVLWCFLNKLCSVCGGIMSNPWRFYTPPFEERGLEDVREKFLQICKAMNERGDIMGSTPRADEPSEAPFHFECGLYSLAVCPFLASPTAKFTALKEIGGDTIDRQGMYLGPANLASFDTLTLRASWYWPTELLDDKRSLAIQTLEQLTFEERVVPEEWALPEKELRRYVMRRFESLDRRMYHRARQGKGVWRIAI